MKTRFLLPMALGLMAVIFNACDKCQICTKSASPEVRVCRGDYNNDSEYDLAITALEWTGYSCN